MKVDQKLTYAHPAFAGKIGVAQADMTPPVGIYARNWGAATHDTAEGIHRPLKMGVLVIEPKEDPRPLVLMCFDFIGWRSPKDLQIIRDALAKHLSVLPERLMIHSTHTHAGPGTITRRTDMPGTDLIEPYIKTVVETAITLTRQAYETRQEATLAWHYGRCGLAQNRDLPDPDPERDRILCGYHPEGKPDDTLLVGRVTNAAGKVIGTLVNYACHPVTLAWQNKLISPDYLGSLRELVEAYTNGAPCLFMQGASGELAPREEYVGDVGIADAHGREVGFAVLSTLEGMLPHNTGLTYSGCVESGAPLATWAREPLEPSGVAGAVQKQVTLDLKEMPTSAEIEAELQKCEDRVMAERLRRFASRRQMVGDGTTMEIPFWAWRLGDAYLLGHPNEAYSDFQLELRRRLAPSAVAVANLTNSSCSYLPPKDLYDKDIYQVWVTPFKAGSLEQVTDECEAALKAL